MHYEHFEYQQYIKFHNEMCYKMLAVNPPQELWLSSNLIFTVLAHYFWLLSPQAKLSSA